MPNIIGSLFRPAARRKLPSGIAQRLIFAFAVGVALYHIISLGIWYAPIDFHSVTHLFTILILTFLGFSCSARESARLPIIDIVLVLACLAVGAYFLLNLDTLMERSLVLTPLSGLELSLIHI